MEAKMVSRFVPVLAGVAMATAASSAFAFDAMVSAPTALRTRASPRAAVIEVIPARAIIDMERCVRGWCEASYAGQIGYVYTPVLVSAAPVSPTDEGPLGVLTAPFTATGAVLGGIVESPGPVVAAY
jgi:uncharacterized protein YraI